MPVVLFTTAAPRSGHSYSDHVGISHEYPIGKYERLITQGERFLYYSPKRGYFGSGVLGVVTDSAPGRKSVRIASWEAFPTPVSLKRDDGTYFEADTRFWRDRVYWGEGVRPLAADRFYEIAQAAAASPRVPAARPPRGGYPPAEVARAVERYAVDVVLEELRTEFGAGLVREMPHSNPGFDVCVGDIAAPTLYVEVKGTQSAEPFFFMSEGEREFSAAHAGKYRLYVVSGVELEGRRHGWTHRRDGEVGAGIATMRPAQWRGLLHVELS